VETPDPIGGILLNKRMTVNLGLVILFAIIAILLYNSGKGYNLLLDNQTVTINGVTFEPTGTVFVSVDDGEPVELWVDDRGMATVKGKKHVLKIEVLDEDENMVLYSVEKRFSIDPEKGTLFSIPAIIAGSSEWVIPKER